MSAQLVEALRAAEDILERIELADPGTYGDLPTVRKVVAFALVAAEAQQVPDAVEHYGGVFADHKLPLASAPAAQADSLAEDFREYLYRVASQVPLEHAEWAQQRGAALLAVLKEKPAAPAQADAVRDELLAALLSVEVADPDGDELVRLVFQGAAGHRKAMWNLGDKHSLVARAALEFEATRRTAIAKAKASQ